MFLSGMHVYIEEEYICMSVIFSQNLAFGEFELSFLLYTSSKSEKAQTTYMRKFQRELKFLKNPLLLLHS